MCTTVGESEFIVTANLHIITATKIEELNPYIR